MDKSKEVIEQYLKEVRREIHNIVPCEDFIASLRRELEDALEGDENVDLQELIEAFGNPETVAKDFLESKEGLQPQKIAKAKRNRNIAIIVLIAALLAVLWYLWDVSKFSQVMEVPEEDIVVIYE